MALEEEFSGGDGHLQLRFREGILHVGGIMEESADHCGRSSWVFKAGRVERERNTMIRQHFSEVLLTFCFSVVFLVYVSGKLLGTGTVSHTRCMRND